jgi:choline dehydrogenase-like flavoprotein
MSFGQRVGLSFNESMSGTMVLGMSDPDQAAVVGAGRPTNFKFGLYVDITSLRDFLDEPAHVANCTRGAVWWDGVCRPDTPIVSGATITMYRDVAPDGTQKDFQFIFGFRGDDGAWYTFIGEKRLKDDGFLDAFQDLSRVFARIQRDGQTIAAGVTTVHFDELYDQILSMQVHDAADLGESAAARDAFFSFMNAELRQVYPGMPLLFHGDEQRYLRPSEWRALALIAQAMLPNPLPAGGPTIDDTVANIQSFVRNSSPGALDELRTKLSILGTFAPLVSGVVSIFRTWLRDNLSTLTADQLDLIDQLKQVAVVPYYAHPKADALVGYARPKFVPRRFTRLEATPSPSTTLVYDVVIIGSGVAGTLLAQRAAEKGKSVLVLEAGRYAPEHEFSSDEMRMTPRLYKASGLQATREGIAVLQGSCVGGGGVVNNAICFQLPDARMDAWVESGFPLAPEDMRRAYKHVADELGIQPVSGATNHINPAQRFLETKLGPVQIPRTDAPPPDGLSECLVNIEKDCEGTGLCNTGCGNERKRNGFQVYLPAAMATGKCTLVPEARVEGIRLQPIGDGRFTVDSIRVDVRGRDVTVRGNEYILAAGAVSSSVVLLNSDVKTKLPHLPIGKRFTANVGCPTFIFAKDKLATRPFLQISHAYLPPDGEGFVIESWYAPPGTVALTMPGYLDAHAARLKRYASATVLAPLVGLTPDGRVSASGQGQASISLPISDVDLQRLLSGISTIARAALETPGIEMVLLGSRVGHEARSFKAVDDFVYGVASSRQLRLGTGHPQGGNAIGTDPTRSVVDPTFHVHGVDNLRVCDASVFPDVAGVNPQWTVMALAHLCGEML